MPDKPRLLITQILTGAALLLTICAQAQAEKLYRVELLVFRASSGDAAEQWQANPDLSYPKSSRFLSAPGGPGEPALFTPLPAAQKEFGGKASRMQSSGRYRVLFHEAWVQPMTSQSRATPLVLDRSGDIGQWPELQGTIKLYLSRYLYLETNLWLNTQGEYLDSSWRMPAPPLGPSSDLAQKPPLQGTLEPLRANPGLTEQAQPNQVVAQNPQELTELQEPTYPYRHAVLIKQTRRMRSGEVNYIDHPMLGVLVKVAPVTVAEPEQGSDTEITQD